MVTPWRATNGKPYKWSSSIIAVCDSHCRTLEALRHPHVCWWLRNDPFINVRQRVTLPDRNESYRVFLQGCAITLTAPDSIRVRYAMKQWHPYRDLKYITLHAFPRKCSSVSWPQKRPVVSMCTKCADINYVFSHTVCVSYDSPNKQLLFR